MSKQTRPVTQSTVWIMAAGFGMPAGIEAHVVHYAVEMRNQGFDTKVVCIKRLPQERHRFLRALDDAEIPIVSMMEKFAGMSAAEYQGYRQRARARYEEVCHPSSVGSVVAEHYEAVLGAARN